MIARKYMLIKYKCKRNLDIILSAKTLNSSINKNLSIEKAKLFVICYLLFVNPFINCQFLYAFLIWMFSSGRSI